MKTRKQVVQEILEAWNSGRKQYAKNKLKLARFILKDETYDYLACKFGMEYKPDMLDKAKQILGGRIYYEGD